MKTYLTGTTVTDKDQLKGRDSLLLRHWVRSSCKTQGRGKDRYKVEKKINKNLSCLYAHIDVDNSQITYNKGQPTFLYHSNLDEP